MAPRRLTTKAEFSRIAGVSKAAISKALTNALRSALVVDKIDVNHPAAVAYLAKRGVDPTGRTSPTPVKKRGPKPKKKVAPPPVSKPRPLPRQPQSAGPAVREARKNIDAPGLSPRDEIPLTLPGLFETQFGDLVDKFWHHTELKGWLDQVKLAREVEKTELANQKAKGVLIDLGLVEVGIMDPVNASWKKMMRDGAKNITDNVILQVLSANAANDGKGVTAEDSQEIEDFVRDSIGSYVIMAKDSCKKALRKFKKKLVA